MFRIHVALQGFGSVVRVQSTMSGLGVRHEFEPSAHKAWYWMQKDKGAELLSPKSRTVRQLAFRDFSVSSHNYVAC